jgi:hypothetical protein
MGDKNNHFEKIALWRCDLPYDGENRVEAGGEFDGQSRRLLIYREARVVSLQTSAAMGPQSSRAR